MSYRRNLHIVASQVVELEPLAPLQQRKGKFNVIMDCTPNAINLNGIHIAWEQRCAQEMLVNISPAIESGLASKLSIQAFVRLQEPVLGAVVQLRFDDIILAGS